MLVCEMFLIKLYYKATADKLVPYEHIKSGISTTSDPANS